MISIQQSPLFEPVLWNGDGFKILDELLVPERIEYIQITQVAQALDAVRQMKTRAFGQVLTFLYSGALLAGEGSRSGEGSSAGVPRRGSCSVMAPMVSPPRRHRYGGWP